eukprot:31477-Pelagococcus_subviridis.AAC.3
MSRARSRHARVRVSKRTRSASSAAESRRAADIARVAASTRFGGSAGAGGDASGGKVASIDSGRMLSFDATFFHHGVAVASASASHVSSRVASLSSLSSAHHARSSASSSSVADADATARTLTGVVFLRTVFARVVVVVVVVAVVVVVVGVVSGVDSGITGSTSSNLDAALWIAILGNAREAAVCFAGFAAAAAAAAADAAATEPLSFARDRRARSAAPLGSVVVSPKKSRATPSTSPSTSTNGGDERSKAGDVGRPNACETRRVTRRRVRNASARSARGRAYKAAGEAREDGAIDDDDDDDDARAMKTDERRDARRGVRPRAGAGC